MHYTLTSGTPEKQRSACVVVGVFEERQLSDAAQALETFRRDTGKLKDVSFPSIAAASAASPGAWMPSSLVRRKCMGEGIR